LARPFGRRGRPSGQRGIPELKVSAVPPWPGLLIREAGQSQKRAPFLLLARPFGRRGGLESEASVVPPLPGLPVGEAGRSRKQDLPVGEASQSRKRAPFFLGQAFQSKAGSPFCPVVRFLGWPRSCASFAVSSVVLCFCWEAGP